MKIQDFELPCDYFAKIKDISELNYYLDTGACLFLYKLDELDVENSELLVPERSFFAIGNNGGDVGIFYSKTNFKIYSMPYTGMELGDEVFLADNFTDFFEKFKKGELKVY